MPTRYPTRNETLSTQQSWPTWLTKLAYRLLSLPDGTHRITIAPDGQNGRKWRIESVGKWENEG